MAPDVLPTLNACRRACSKGSPPDAKCCSSSQVATSTFVGIRIDHDEGVSSSPCRPLGRTVDTAVLTMAC